MQELISLTVDGGWCPAGFFPSWNGHSEPTTEAKIVDRTRQRLDAYCMHSSLMTELQLDSS
jgi:hypothetical protein